MTLIYYIQKNEWNDVENTRGTISFLNICFNLIKYLIKYQQYWQRGTFNLNAEYVFINIPFAIN